MDRPRRGFTLIELLVVIAVIAILAAILFPVFASAKVAAKGAASMSNSRQIGIAHEIYRADFDDLAVPAGIIDDSSPVFLQGYGYMSWGYILRDYIKDSSLLQDPLTRPEPALTTHTQKLSWYFTTQVGYAYTVHAPWMEGTDSRPVSSTAVANPAETVLFTTKKARNGQPDWLITPSPIWGANLVNPPYCYSTTNGVNPESRCFPIARWGINTPSYAGQTFEEGGHTGGVAFRKNGRSCVVFADGHAAFRTSEQLAAGTTWRRGITFSGISINDKSRYMWDID